jgi:hypothetical protein
LIEGENQGAIEARGVVSAGGMTKMMIEVGRSGSIAKDLVKKLLRSGTDMTLAARARGGKNSISKSDGADFRKLQTILKEAAIERQTGDLRRVLQASEFFLFNGKEDAAVIQECDGGTAA